MPILDERHDFAHPVEGDTAWSESYYFNGYDPATDTGLFTRIGVRPNEGTIDVGLSLWLPGDRVASMRAVREQREMTDDDLRVGGVAYERSAPLKEWRLTAADGTVTSLVDGTELPVAMDLTWSALTPAVGVDGQSSPSSNGGGVSQSTASTVGKGHLEQAGRWTGTISAGGETWTLGPDARGNRDKSWGPRRWGGPQMWRWFSINIGDDTHFGGIRIGTPAGDLHRGWVWTDGDATSIKDWDVRSVLADDGVTHRTTDVRATDKRGRVHELHGEVLRVYGVPHATGDGSTIVNEGLARWTYDGRTGYGIAEYLHQLDAAGRPKIPIE